ncbi:WD40/YVTN/BNR-like repeat-containing protein [Tahibacter amnicola]|uniref:Sortilin (Neurotensin receptor 3) n=1 Tax=Tahibacter amnicola TaxID=2976241 RepID=A0ABY6BC90_9GAMM|nr:hypothetical protein [Tahibacter amnicola]UXI67656.1 hypothetical protein N4264_23420 [Tahibacter amnicola]
MSTKLLLGLSSLSAVLLAGCASTSSSLRADHDAHSHAGNKALLIAAQRGKEREGPKQRFDAPREAQRFFVEQRLPPDATELDPKLYEAARRQADQLAWYSSARNSIVQGADYGILNELSSWQSLGPGNIGGRTRVLRFHPSNPNIMYAAAVAGGVWKSTNAGTTWTPLSDLAGNLAVVSMAIDTTNPNRMWVGTGEGVFNGDAARGAGIFVSNDSGNSWNQLPATDNSDFFFVNDLIQSPNSANTLYAATQTGILRSLDSGATWTKVVDSSASGINVFGGCFDLSAIPGGPQDTILGTCGTFGGNATFSALANGVILRNTDAAGAGTWTSVLSSGTPGTQGRSMVAVAPSNPQIVYALVAGGDGAPGTVVDGLLGVWRSADGGATWTPKVQNDGTNANKNLLLTNPVYGRLLECEYGAASEYYNQGWYDLILAVDPVNPDRVWAGGIDLWRSDDQGDNWGIASYWWFNSTDPNYAHADNHGLFFHPNYNGTTNRILYATSDGGIFRTDDATAAVGTDASAGTSNSICGNENLPALTWTNLNNGYNVSQFYNGTVYPSSQTYFGGTQDNGTLRGSDGGPNAWDMINGGDGGYTAVDSTNTQVLYAEFTGISIVKSTDGGANFNDAVTGIADAGMFINPFTMDPNNSSRLWTSGRRLWRTDNAAGNWTQASSNQLSISSPFTSSHRFSAHAVAPGLSDLVVAGTSQGQLYRTTTATTATSATTWTSTTTGANGRPRSGLVGMIAFDPTQNETNPNERTVVAVYASFNSAATFGGGLTAPHVWKSTDGGQTWTGIDGTAGASIPNVPVHSVVIDPTTANAQRIFVGTDIGVFVTTDGGQTWLRENAGGANTIIEWLIAKKNPTTSLWELFAFTHGRSAYKTTFAAGDYLFANGFD